MKWFQGITTLKELRKEYRRLVVKHHPDNGGNEDVIKEINAEYDRLFKKLKYDYEHEDTYSKATDKQKQQYDWQKTPKSGRRSCSFPDLRILPLR